MCFFTEMLLLAINVEIDNIHKKVRVVHSQNWKQFYRQLSILEHICCNHRIPRCTLIVLKESSWQWVFVSRSNQTLIMLTEFDLAMFELVEHDYKNFFNSFSQYSKDGKIVTLNAVRSTGWPRLMTSSDCLGLILAWTRPCGSRMILELIFSMTQAIISYYLLFCTHILANVLTRMEDAKIRCPDGEKSC